MKLNKLTKYTGIAGMVISAVWLFSACSSMTSSQEKFLEDGETVYRGKADSIMVFPGKNRAKVSWLLSSDFEISKARVYWNERSDSVEIAVNRTHETDTLSVMLDDLEEGPYSFEIVTFDNDGNTSLPVSITGRVYGAKYESNLLNRLVQSTGFTTEDKVFLEWSNVGEEVIGTELMYTDDTGGSKTLLVSASDDVTLLDDYQLHSTYQYRTLYIPEPMAIDTFYTDWAETKIEGEPVPVFADTTYTIVARHSGKAIAVADSSISNGGNVMQDTYDAAAPEQWEISAESVEGYYQYYVIGNRYSGKAMAVSGASNDDGANILQWDLGSGGNDLWTFVWVDEEYFKVVNLNSGKVLEIADNDMSDRANLQQNTWDGGENQQFKIEVVADPAAPNAGPKNLALTAEIDASSDCSCGREEEVADGDMDTYVQFNSGERADLNVYIEIDLGSVQTISQLDQYWRSGNGQVVRYRVLYSDDGENWYLAYMKEVDDGLDDFESATFPSPVTARYVKLDIDNNDDGNIQIREIELYNNE